MVVEFVLGQKMATKEARAARESKSRGFDARTNLPAFCSLAWSEFEQPTWMCAYYDNQLHLLVRARSGNTPKAAVLNLGKLAGGATNCREQINLFGVPLFVGSRIKLSVYWTQCKSSQLTWTRWRPPIGRLELAGAFRPAPKRWFH